SALCTEIGYGEKDVDWLLANYGHYVVESGEDGQAVYRLYHQLLIDHLRKANSRGASAFTVIALALLALNDDQTRGGGRPEAANPYLIRNLVIHALKGGSESTEQYRRLAESNPVAYIPRLASLLIDLSNAFGERGQRGHALVYTQE